MNARASWLLEPKTDSGMLLYPRDWTFIERRDVHRYLHSQGWVVVPLEQFFDVTTDGTTVIRLLDRIEKATGDAASALADVYQLRPPAVPADQLEASV